MRKTQFTKVFLLAGLMVAFLSGNAQKLPAFKSETLKKGPVTLPYTDMISYYGYVKPGAAPDETRDGKKYYYLYIWVPAVAPELGIRMVSPAPKEMKPAEGDFIADNWKEAEADTKNYFDTWVTLEKAADITKAEEIVSKVKATKWNSFGSNDDSSELPANPGGSKYNSVLRVISEPSNPLKALTVGLYRIGFTTYKVGEVQGSFLAQVGAPVKLPGVFIAKDPQSLVDAMNKKKDK